MTSQRLIRTVALAATVFCCCFFGLSLAEAQVRGKLPTQFRDDSYVVELDKMFEEWNAFKLSLPKRSSLAPIFEKRLKEIVTKKRYLYQTEDWAQGMRKRFADLKEELKPERKINDPAAQLLLLFLIKDLSDFKKQVPVAKVREELHLPVFLIFSSAQQEVKAADRLAIDSVAIVGSLLGWWTTIWPFCD